MFHSTDTEVTQFHFIRLSQQYLLRQRNKKVLEYDYTELSIADTKKEEALSENKSKTNTHYQVSSLYAPLLDYVGTRHPERFREQVRATSLTAWQQLLPLLLTPAPSLFVQ